jgi:hypothetical protein
MRHFDFLSKGFCPTRIVDQLRFDDTEKLAANGKRARARLR